MSLLPVPKSRPRPAVRFPSDQSQLSNSAEAVLSSLVADLKSWSALRITITGYGDDVGSATGNFHFSIERACAVATVLKLKPEPGG